MLNKFNDVRPLTFSVRQQKMAIAVGFGNPLLDITVQLKNAEILQKYNLEKDGQKEVPEEVLREILADISEYKVSYSAGGCAQNTLRVLQWLLGVPGRTYIYGCVGKDGRGEKLKEILSKDGVETRYTIDAIKPTGTTVALVNGLNRSLVANIGAAECITTKDLILKEKSDNLLFQTDFIYLEGFFLTNRIEIANYVLDYAKKQNKSFVFNICGTYMCTDFPEETKYFAGHCDLLFGNAKEYTALARIMGFQEDIRKFAVLLSSNKSSPLPYGKMVIITDGPNSIFCSHSNGQVEEVAVPPVKPEEVKDTTGAGDSFVAGFLAGLIEKRPPKECLKWGCWAAHQIIKQSGCTLPSHPPTDLRNMS